MKTSFFIFFLMSCSLSIWGQSNLDNSVWENQEGSYLHITQVTDGLISGYYVNNASGYNCQGTPYPLTGWVLNGTNTITFSVQWNNAYANCYSLTSWTGFFNAADNTITTLWQLVANGTSSTSQILQGEDSFVRVSQTQHTSFIAEGALVASYYNSMLTGTDRSIANCQEVYERLRGYNISVVSDCGHGMDGTCNKRIKYTGAGGIAQVRIYFARVIADLDLELEYTVNSKASCEF